jgi:carbamate kinase
MFVENMGLMLKLSVLMQYFLHDMVSWQVTGHSCFTAVYNYRIIGENIHRVPVYIKVIFISRNKGLNICKRLCGETASSGIPGQTGTKIGGIRMEYKGTIVVALGGNAILQPGQKGTDREQMENVHKTCVQIAAMIKEGYRVVITHGNGPQVGNILIQNGTGADKVPAMPLDICGAESQGLIGYMMQQQMTNILGEMGIHTPVVTVVTQMVVDREDPAFKNPTKPVGPFYSKEYAEEMKKKGENWIEDAGRGWRKVVPSPNPIRIVEIDAILDLINRNCIVIANGGGGIPVVEEDGRYKGVEAVIDKDFGGERLAFNVKADTFMILTDVPKAYINYNKPNQEALGVVTVEELEGYQKEGHFKAGSMGPKVEACRRFVVNGGKNAIITSLDTALEALRGEAGTRVVKGR